MSYCSFCLASNHTTKIASQFWSSLVIRWWIRVRKVIVDGETPAMAPGNHQNVPVSYGIAETHLQICSERKTRQTGRNLNENITWWQIELWQISLHRMSQWKLDKWDDKKVTFSPLAIRLMKQHRMPHYTIRYVCRTPKMDVSQWLERKSTQQKRRWDDKKSNQRIDSAWSWLESFTEWRKFACCNLQF